MWDLPGDLGLIVIDDLPETIGWMKGEKYVIYFALWKMSHLGNAFCSASIW